MKTILTIKDIHIDGFSQGQWTPIVKGIDLHLKEGEVLGLIGESGAGKSTLGLASMAYTRQGCRISSGSIHFKGQDLTKTSESDLQSIRGVRIAYVAQSAAASFNPAHRLIHQFAEGPVQHGLMDYNEAEDNAVNIYEQMLLPDPESIGFRFPHQVSGGQLQRAMVAMAMSCKPDIIVFDEPTTALDVTTQIEVLAAIRDITRRFNTAAIYITHDLAVVAQLADRIMVLRNGGLVEENDARTLLAHPKEEYTRNLLKVRTFAKNETKTDTPAEALLDINGISAGYNGSDLVLSDINLTIPKGQTVALVGESGSGKSSLARVIAGLLPQRQGSISFKNVKLPKALKNRSREDLRRLQMIYQMPDTALNPKQTLRKIIGRPLQFYFQMKKERREERILELLDQIELPADYIDRYPTELSGGEKQRVCIARALAAEPELIICDEVTSALDQLVAEDILKLLLRLQQKLNISYLFITHDLATVKAIADDIVVMLNGKIIEMGPKKEILRPPHHEYTSLLLSSVPKMDPDWLTRLLADRGNMATPRLTAAMAAA
jgi:peptide/nickel transport system ATP-binding protein